METLFYRHPTWRDREAAEIRRQLDAHAARLDCTDAELAAMVRRLRDVALRSTEGIPCPTH